MRAGYDELTDPANVTAIEYSECTEEGRPSTRPCSRCTTTPHQPSNSKVARILLALIRTRKPATSGAETEALHTP